MPQHTGGLLGQIGYDASSLSDLFGQTFAKPKAAWEKFLQPAFTLAGEALGELPGQRKGLLGEVTSGLQKRSFVAGRQLEGRAATGGFAGSGQIEQLGDISRRDIGRDYTSGLRGVNETIARREAGILGALSGKVSGFLGQLLAAETKLVGEDTGPLSFGEWKSEGGKGGMLGYNEYKRNFSPGQGPDTAVEDTDPAVEATDPNVIADVIAAGAPDIPGEEGETSPDGQWVWKSGIWERRFPEEQQQGYEGPVNPQFSKDVPRR